MMEPRGFLIHFQTKRAAGRDLKTTGQWTSFSGSGFETFCMRNPSVNGEKMSPGCPPVMTIVPRKKLICLNGLDKADFFPTTK